MSHATSPIQDDRLTAWNDPKATTLIRLSLWPGIFISSTFLRAWLRVDATLYQLWGRKQTSQCSWIWLFISLPRSRACCICIIAFHVITGFALADAIRLRRHQHPHDSHKYTWFDRIFPYITDPFMGHTWNSYYYHHVKHHHIEPDGSDDLSSTIRYQRDDLLSLSSLRGLILLFRLARFTTLLQTEEEDIPGAQNGGIGTAELFDALSTNEPSQSLRHHLYISSPNFASTAESDGWELVPTCTRWRSWSRFRLSIKHYSYRRCGQFGTMSTSLWAIVGNLELSFVTFRTEQSILLQWRIPHLPSSQPPAWLSIQSLS